MSENITHTAILDDCFRLMLHSDGIAEPLKLAAREHHEFARLGGVTRSGDMFTVQLLQQYREAWPQRTPQMRIEPKLAFVLAWLTHRAADRQMKPVFRAAEPDRRQSPSDCSVYHDAFIFREVFAGGAEEPYRPGMFGEAFVGYGIEDGFRALLQRTLASMHTFIPDRDNIESWLDKLFSVQQRFTIDLRRYAEAIERPDTEKVRRFIDEPNFYDRGEPIIRIARQIQHEGKADSKQVAEAAAADAKSHYAQALRMGLGYLRNASDFFEGKLSADELSDRLEIGRPGRDGKVV
jgi:hypothetical protein